MKKGLPEHYRSAIKWYTMALAVLIGTAAFIRAEETGGLNPVAGIGVAGYGYAYIMVSLWKNKRRDVLLNVILSVLVLAFVSGYVSDFLISVFGEITIFGRFMILDANYIWAFLLTVVGVPFIAYIFKHFD